MRAAMLARPSGAGIAAFLVLLVAPAEARAAEAGIVTDPSGGKAVTYRGDAGEINQVSLNLQGTNYTIQDSAGPAITVRPPCAPLPLMLGLGTGASCPAVNVERLHVDLGDQTDQIFIGGVSHVLVPATIRGGPGADRMDGGEGGDTIDAFDQTADVIGCHAGIDTVYADQVDAVAADCENVKHAPTTGTELLPGPTEVLPGPTEAPQGFGLSVAVARAYRFAAAYKGLALRLGCSSGCTIKARLVLDRRRARRLGLGDVRGFVVGRAAATRLSTAGKTRVLIDLTRRAKRAFRGLRRVTVKVEVQAIGSVGGAVTLSTPVTFHR
jgi:hypothetical protein